MIFLPVPDGDIADTVTFYDGFIGDYQLYQYRTFFPRPRTERVKEVFSAIEDSGVLPLYGDGHFVIHQSTGSWVGEGFQEFRKQIFNQEERYDSARSDYPLETYKNETAIFMELLSTGDYLVLNVDPWTNGELRHFEICLILDGLPLNDGRFDDFLDGTGLRFGTGKPWNPRSQLLSGKAVSGIKSKVRELVTDEEGWVEGVVCENPLYEKDGFLSRLFPNRRNIVADQKYIVASCTETQSKTDTVSVNHIKITDYNEIGRDAVQNIHVDVSFN